MDVDTEGLDEENELDERLWEDLDSEDDESDRKQLQVLIGWILMGVKE